MTALLTHNLPMLAGAPNGIKKLRELILELAVRGKLVPQDPNDEPASELLKRIAEEKARLVAEGKIKKQKPLADINANGVPFEIPVTWEWARLGEITNFGITVKKEEIPEDAWVLDLEDIEKDTSKLLQKACLKERNSLSDKNSFTKGDVLYGKLRPYLNKVLVADEDGFCTTEILPFRCYGPFVAHYFMGALKSPYFLGYVNARSYGMKMPRLGTEDGRQAFFPLPPLAEQHRIVAKVDELMALCDRLEARQADAGSAHAQLVQALLDSLTHARDSEDFAQSWQRLAEHFHTLFTTESSIDALKQTLLQLAVMGKLVPQYPNDESASEFLKRIAEEKARLVLEGRIKRQSPLADVAEEEKLFALPSSWVWVRLEGIAQVGTGATPLRTNPKYFDPATVNWLTSGETSQDFIRVTEQKVSSLALTETNLTVYPPHTLIIAMYGQGKTRGQISELLIDACTNQACAAIQLFDPNPSHRRYVKHFFVKSYDDLRMLAAGGAQPNLNLGKIKDSVIPLPPLAEQHRIVAKVDQLMALCDQLKSRLSEARQVNEHLANALTGQALNNEKKSRAETVDFSAYLISKLAPRRTFGRVAHMKLLFLADSHLGLGLMDGYRRHAAGPLDTTIYRVEERAAQEGLYSTSIEVLKSGQEKVSYHIGANISRSVETAASALGAAQKELDRLIALFEGRKTEDLEAVATLYAVWNDALAGGASSQ
ncbi:restriction endonuclease subunit S [Xanthomonas arboricola]|uniref:restriction endonuclease subunit S n=1 Tax=Xanthomonas arboricola TaxID=56448 RepID=UPI0007DC198C|nr:restriction endonuclease subunit S [Xanthomonas arboricola]